MKNTRKAKKPARKSIKQSKASLGPTTPVQKPAYGAALELISVRKIALQEALAEMYGIGGEK